MIPAFHYVGRSCLLSSTAATKLTPRLPLNSGWLSRTYYWRTSIDHSEAAKSRRGKGRSKNNYCDMHKSALNANNIDDEGVVKMKENNNSLYGNARQSLPKGGDTSERRRAHSPASSEYDNLSPIDSSEFYAPRLTESNVEIPKDMLPKYQELLINCQDQCDFFKTDNSDRGQRLYTSLLNWQPIILNANDLVQKVNTFAHEYDLDESTPGNGYRSFIGVTNAMIDYSQTICQGLTTTRNAVFFRKKFYMKEVESCYQVLTSLCSCLRYLITLNQWSKNTGDLFALGKYSAEELFETGETINQYCFYGRCLGFQYNDTIRNIVRFISISMASFSEAFYGRDIDGPWLKTTRNVWTSGKYLLNPELRARRIVNLSQNAKIDFCKAFWFLAESEIMQRLPSMVGSYIKINQVIEIPPEPLQVPHRTVQPVSAISPSTTGTNAVSPPDLQESTASTEEMVDIPVPTSHLGPGLPVNVRLLSQKRREGMIGLGQKGFRPWRRLSPRCDSILFHCHGGGFVAQSSKSHELYLRDWAVALDAPILSVDYSLAPEAPYPRAIEEVFYAYCWMIKNAEYLGTSAKRVVLAGDSAGANLCIALTLKCIEMGVRIPDGVFLAYCPTLINFVPSPARLLCLMDPLLPFGFMMRCLRAYAAPTPMKTNSKQDELLKKIRLAGEQEPHYVLNLNPVPKSDENGGGGCNDGTAFSDSTPSTLSPKSSIAENSKWEQIKVHNSSNLNGSIVNANDDQLESTDNTFAGASYPNQTIEQTDLPVSNSSSMVTFEEDSQPIAERYESSSTQPINCTESEKYIDNFVDMYITNDEKEDKIQETLSVMPAKTMSEENLLSSTGTDTLDGIQGMFQQAFQSISNTFQRITKSYEIKSDGLPADQLDDLRNMDTLIARSPSVEFGFQVPNDPFLSPYYASDDWLKQMPPIKITTIEMDPCLDDCVMFAKKLKSFQRPVTLDILKGLPHGFLNFTMVSNEAMEGSRHCIRRIKELLTTSTDRT